MDAETNIASRTSGKLRGAHSEVRPEKVRERQYEPYRPRGLQDVPPSLKNKMEGEGWHVHWVRVLLEGETDTENLADVAHKGYEPVDVSEVPANILRTLQITDVAGLKGLIVSKDTALFKIPADRYEEIREYYREIADSQLRSVNENIKQNASMHGLTVELHDESKSIVSTGKNARRVMAQEDEK
jgi:hypothetical protein